MVGFATGGVLCFVEIKNKDLRDDRLRRQGIPVPSDRVTPRHYHWVFMVLGVVFTSVLLAFGAPWLLAALSPLAFAFLPVLFLAGGAAYSIVNGFRHG